MMVQKHRSPYHAMAIYTTILSQLVGLILIGTFGGNWVDHHFNTEPLFFIIGLLLGLTLGIWAMLHTV
jgi:ATP synthase protein I